MKNYLIIIALVFLSLSSSCQSSYKHLQKHHSSELTLKSVPVVKAELNISTKGDQFVDPSGRTMFLRGINLGGSSKVPYSPRMGSHVQENFFNGTDISFVGRPFPLKEADVHFRRLKEWGFHFIRFIVTWEAIEHEGPGIYDTEYLDYLEAVLTKANEYGLNVMIDPHQDLWSRYTGGDGAPLWTMELAGMNPRNFQKTEAAFVHNVCGDPYPQMIWFSNYYKLASATMFTLFFAGNDFAPNCLVENQPIQDYLQQHYINAMVEVAKHVAHLPNVVGFELMNEPSSGYLGLKNIDEPFATDILGAVPTPFESMLLGDGNSALIDSFSLGPFSLKDEGKVKINNERLSIWKNKEGCIWRQHSVWGYNKENQPEILQKEYFSLADDDFNRDYYEPFAVKYAHAINAINPDWFICVDNVLFPLPHPLPELKKYNEVKWINGSHWYDDVTLVKKKYWPFLGLVDGKIIVGSSAVRKAYEKVLSDMIDETHEKYGNVPSLLGEFGIPFDLNKGKAYKTGNFSMQVKALDRCFNIVEKNNLHYTLWNYTADNNNKRGDHWNGEDLSVFSLSQQSNNADINSGGRALDAAVRPYPKKINGVLNSYSWDYKKQQVTIVITNKELSDYPTEIHLPPYVFNDEFYVYSTDGDLAYDKKENVLMYWPKSVGQHQLVITKK